MGKQAPAVRSSLLKAYLEVLGELGAARAGRIRERVPVPMLAEIERSTPDEWIGMASSLALLEATEEELGADEAFQFWRRKTGHMLAIAPIAKSFIDGVRSLRSPSPLQLLQWVPKANTLVYRDVGTFLLETLGDKAARMLQTGVPGFMIHSAAWRSSRVAGLLSTLELLPVSDATAAMTDLDLSRPRIEITLQWC